MLRPQHRSFIAGSFVWTLGDYLGEPVPIPWPHVSSSFGAVDLAGFPKAGARWFQAWWLHTKTAVSPTSRPPLPEGDVVHIVETLQAPLEEPTTEPNVSAHVGNYTFHVYTSADSAEMLVNGVSVGQQPNSQWMGWLEWNFTSLPVGNITAVARDKFGNVVASHTRHTPAPALAIRVTIDAPSPTTGTGSRVVLDGHDVALVRATIVDAAGRPAPQGRHNVTFEVLSGPGRVLGVGNGDPACHEPHQATWRSSYNALARAIIKVSVDAASSAEARTLMRQIDRDSSHGPVLVVDPAARYVAAPIVVKASAPGLASGITTIQVSVDASTDGVLATASANVLSPVSLD